MAIQYSSGKISGIASDTKPTPSANEKGLLFVETDTNKLYQWDTDSWNEITGLDGGTLSLTADGGITAGKGVYVSSDGKAKQLQYASQAGPVALTAGDDQYQAITYDSNTDRFILFYTNNDKNALYSRVFEFEAAGTVDLGTEATIASSLSGVEVMGLIFDSNRNKVVGIYERDSNLYSRVGTITGGSTNSCSWGSEVAVNSRGDTHVVGFGVTFDSYRNKVIVLADQDSSKSGSISAATVTVGTVDANGDISWGTPVGIATANESTADCRIIFMPAKQQSIIVNSEGATWDSRNAHARTCTLDANGAVTLGSEAALYSSAASGSMSVAWANDLQKGIVTYGLNGDMDDTLYKTFTVDSNAVTFEESGTLTGREFGSGSAIIYSEAAGHYLYFGRNAESGDVFMSTTVTPNSSDNTIAISDDFTQRWGTQISDPNYNIIKNVVYVNEDFGAGTSKGLVFALEQSSNGVIQGFRFMASLSTGAYDTTTPAVDAEEVIGIATTTVADGATVKVAVTGSIVTGLSGLTAGKGYYVDGLGGGLTADAPAAAAFDNRIGVALSSSKLLITNDVVSD
jgi:hypothetical protein